MQLALAGPNIWIIWNKNKPHAQSMNAIKFLCRKNVCCCYWECMFSFNKITPLLRNSQHIYKKAASFEKLHIDIIIICLQKMQSPQGSQCNTMTQPIDHLRISHNAFDLEPNIWVLLICNSSIQSSLVVKDFICGALVFSSYILVVQI